MNTAFQWMGIVMAMGVVLMVIEYQFAKKKKEGFTPTDKQRILGILWVSIVISLLVGGLIWLAD
jgi:hypothetical protein